MSVNKVILIGNLGRDPEVRHLEGGKVVANFSLATSEKVNGNEVTEWHNIVVWNKGAEIAEKYLKKGSKIFVEGKIRSRNWEDKDKNKRTTVEILCDNFQMLDGRREGADPSYQKPAMSSSGRSNAGDFEAPVNDGTDDDLPF